MDTGSIEKWFQAKLDIANVILETRQSDADHGIPDGEIILCCATSALAAIMWPGDNIDKKRFTEFLIRFSPPASLIRRVSIPRLVASLQEKAQENGSIAIKKQFAKAEATIKERFYSNHPQEIVDGDSIDQNEDVVFKAVPELKQSEVRKASYAGLFYSDLRSGLVHQYNVGPLASTWSFSDRQDIPSYGVGRNQVRLEEAKTKYGLSHEDAWRALPPERRIYFPYAYVRDVVLGAANNAMKFWTLAEAWKQEKPAYWWIDGEPKANLGETVGA